MFVLGGEGTVVSRGVVDPEPLQVPLCATEVASGRALSFREVTVTSLPCSPPAQGAAPELSSLSRWDSQELWAMPWLERGAPREKAAGEEEEAGASSQGQGKCIPSLGEPCDEFSWKCCRKICFGKMSLETAVQLKATGATS